MAYMRTVPGVSYTTARARSGQLLARPHIRSEILAARRAQRLRCQVKADEVLEEVARIAFSDIYQLFDPQTNLLRTPRHIPYETRKAISSIQVSRERRTQTTSGKTKTVHTEQVIRYTFWNKNDALQKLANFLSLNTAIPPLETLLSMFPPQVAEQIKEAMRKPNSIPTAHSSNGNGKHPPLPPAPPDTPIPVLPEDRL